MAGKVVRFADWCDPVLYHGFKPPRRDEPWDEISQIYLVRAGEFVKIGVGLDAERRINGMRSGCPYPIETLSVRSVPRAIAYQVERRIHQHLAAERVHGEWFRVDAQVAKAAISLHISRGRLAMQKWTRKGYHAWEPPRRRVYCPS